MVTPPDAIAAQTPPEGDGQGHEARPNVEVLLPYKVAKKHWSDYFDRVYLPALIERCGGNVSKAARECQLDRAYLFRLLRRYGLRG